MKKLFLNLPSSLISRGSRLISSFLGPLLSGAAIVPVFVALLFFGAMVWARSDDPFVRKWFKVKTISYWKVECVTVLPKPLQARPMVVYLHDSGGSLMTDGRPLRQLAELGMAAVSLEYDQTNDVVFEAQFSAVLEHLEQKVTKETKRNVAWVGDGLGAQKALRYLLKHPEARPRVMVMLSGEGSPELGSKENLSADNAEVADRKGRGIPQFLLVHGERDEVVPVSEVRRLAEGLAANGFLVDLKILPGLGHSFEPERALVMREVGEYVKAQLTPEHPQPEFAQPRTIPFLVCALPSFLWVGFCLWKGRGKGEPRNTLKGGEKGKISSASFSVPVRVFRVFRGDGFVWEVVLRVVALVLAVLALAQTAWHLIPPRLEVSERTLQIARQSLLSPKWHDDFEALACRPLFKNRPLWKGQKLKTLLTHVELAHYCVYELINWKLPPEIYRDYVLSPVIEGSETEMNWRRPLWEFYYPRIRKENTTEAAAEIVVRTLRERVTVWPGFERPQGIDTIWKEQITGERGFELIYVATLRSVGVPARLDSARKAEFWDGEKWKPAPRPLLTTWQDLTGR